MSIPDFRKPEDILAWLTDIGVKKDETAFKKILKVFTPVWTDAEERRLEILKQSKDEDILWLVGLVTNERARVKSLGLSASHFYDELSMLDDYIRGVEAKASELRAEIGEYMEKVRSA